MQAKLMFGCRKINLYKTSQLPSLYANLMYTLTLKCIHYCLQYFKCSFKHIAVSSVHVVMDSQFKPCFQYYRGFECEFHWNNPTQYFAGIWNMFTVVSNNAENWKVGCEWIVTMFMKNDMASTCFWVWKVTMMHLVLTVENLSFVHNPSLEWMHWLTESTDWFNVHPGPAYLLVKA